MAVKLASARGDDGDIGKQQVVEVPLHPREQYVRVVMVDLDHSNMLRRWRQGRVMRVPGRENTVVSGGKHLLLVELPERHSRLGLV